ncbi:MAG: hypothetical protein ACPH4G_08220 [Henriciella sp.]
MMSVFFCPAACVVADWHCRCMDLISGKGRAAALLQWLADLAVIRALETGR